MHRWCDKSAIVFRPAHADGTGFRLIPVDEAGSSFPAAELNLLDAVRGNLAANPAFAIMADWEIAPGGDPSGFEASRIALFEQRVDVIPGFFADLLFRHEDEPRRYTVLGLYRDRDDRTWLAVTPQSRHGRRRIP